jgi:hypothetical protein
LKNYSLTILFAISCFSTFGQSILSHLVISNNSSKKLFVTQTSYYADTTKSNTSGFIDAYSKSSSSTDTYKQYIRIDIFALDISSLDTIFSRTVNLVNFDSTRLTIVIIPNQKSHLPTLHPIDRLNIHADNRDIVFKIDDDLEVKTIDNLIVKGLIQSYSNTSVTIKLKNSISTIPMSDIRDIKLCKPGILISASFSLFNKCSFYSIDKSLTKTVRQKQVKYSNGYSGWDWR